MNLDDLKRRMNGTISVLRGELSGLRTGRASPSLLDPITVQAYGNTMPLNQLATISVSEARMITVCTTLLTFQPLRPLCPWLLRTARPT